jgi:hypothetical protein
VFGRAKVAPGGIATAQRLHRRRVLATLIGKPINYRTDNRRVKDHLTAAIQADVADRVGGLLWATTETTTATTADNNGTEINGAGGSRRSRSGSGGISNPRTLAGPRFQGVAGRPSQSFHRWSGVRWRPRAFGRGPPG